MRDTLDTFDHETFGEYVPVHLIKTAKYCRPVSEFTVNRMLRDGFDKDAFGVLMLSLQADGSYHILDGNHRLQVARKLGIEVVPAKVFIDKTYEEEAALFKKLNTTNRPTAMARFRADLEAKNPEALDIKRVVESHGLKIALGGDYPSLGAVGAVGAVGSLIRAYQDLGPLGFRDIIDLLYDAWQLERRAWVTPMIDGARQFWARYRTEIDKRYFVSKLQKVTPEKVLALAGVGMASTESPGAAVGKQFVKLYDHGKKGVRLSPWQENMGPGKSYYEGPKSDLTASQRLQGRGKKANKNDAPVEPAF